MIDRTAGKLVVCPYFEGDGWEKKEEGTCKIFARPKPGYSSTTNIGCAEKDRRSHRKALVRIITTNSREQDKSSTCPCASNEAGLRRRGVDSRITLGDLFQRPGRR